MNESQKYLARMNDSEQESLILRLGRYTVKECRRLKWRTSSSIDLPKGETSESIVSKAFERVLSGDRIWNPQNDPDFAKYMMDVIDSLLSHLVNSSDNKMLTTQPEAGSKDDSAWHGAIGKHEQKYEQNAGWLSRKPLSPEQILFDKEHAQASRQAMSMLEDSIRDDGELVIIVKIIRAGANKNGEIAEHAGIAIRDVEKAKKRLDRKLTAINKYITDLDNKRIIPQNGSNNNERQKTK